MRRRSNTHSPMSLFPFLDTLVCTMGSLILMLLAMAPRIRERAEAREQARIADATLADREVVPPEPDPIVSETPAAVAVPETAPDEEERALARQRNHEAWLKMVAESRDALLKKQAAFKQQRELLKEAERQLKSIDDQILAARLKNDSASETHQTLSETENRLEQQRTAVTRKIAETRKNLELLNRKQAAKANEYALVPYDGTSGTSRRPIYIECSARGFRFLPENETVSPADLGNFTESYNPLLAGTQALLRLWKERRRESSGSEPEPYVLLLVRPSGCLNYYLARNFLTPLGANFGYELIEENWKLSVPDADPVAKTLLQETLDMTIQAGARLKESLASGRGSRSPFDGRESRGGSFAAGDDDDADGTSYGSGPKGKRNPRITFGPPTRGFRDSPRGGSSGGPGGDLANEDGIATGRPASGVPGSTDGAIGGTGKGPGRGTGTGGGASAAMLAGGASRGRAGGSGGGTSSDPASESGSGDGLNRLLAGTVGGKSGGSIGNGPSSTTDDDSVPMVLDGPDQGVPGTGRSGSGSGRPGGARAATLGGSPFDSESSDSTADPDEPPRLLPENSRNRGSKGGPGGPSGRDGGQADSDDEFPSRQMPLDSTDAADGTSGSASGANSGPGGKRSGPARSGSSSPGQGSSTSSSPSSGASNAAGAALGDPSDDDPPAGSPPPGNIQMGGPGVNLRLGRGNQGKKSSDKSDDSGPRIAKDDDGKGGQAVKSNAPRLWGKAGRKASIGTIRKLDIHVMSDRIVIGKKETVIRISKGQTTQEIIERVVSGIDRAAEKWGDPPANFYWVPTVKFIVYPGGNPYYERLRGTLENKWGVSSTLEYVTDEKAGKSAAGGRP